MLYGEREGELLIERIHYNETFFYGGTRKSDIFLFTAFFQRSLEIWHSKSVQEASQVCPNTESQLLPQESNLRTS